MAPSVPLSPISASAQQRDNATPSLTSSSSSSSVISPSEDDHTVAAKYNPPSRVDYRTSSPYHLDRLMEGSNLMVSQYLYRNKEFICGFGSALINICVTFPINKLIFRQQLHGISELHAFQQLHKDGLRHLYRGMLSPLFQKTASVSIMFGVYTKSRKNIENALPHLSPSSTILLSALIAGTLEATLTPFERVQTLMQTRKYHNRFSNTLDAFTALRQYGFREYYRGLSGIILRNGPSNCLFFFGREYLTVTEADNSTGQKFAKDFVSGACLGAFISTLFFPVNVMKTHMQAQLGGPFVNIWTTFRTLLAARDGSIKNLYKGVHLNYTRSFISWGIINASYEILMKGFTHEGNGSRNRKL